MAADLPGDGLARDQLNLAGRALKPGLAGGSGGAGRAGLPGRTLRQ
jgi:hypothetical protein